MSTTTITNNIDLFIIIWRNLYLRTIISKFLKLFKKYKQVEFTNRKELLNHEYRSYIETIIYSDNDNILEYGDLPNDGILNKVVLTKQRLANIAGNIIPNGVTEVVYPFRNSTIEIELELLPSSVTTVVNHLFQKYDSYIYDTKNKKSSIQTTPQKKQIPKSITSLSSPCYPMYSPFLCKGFIHSSMKVLDLGNWTNNKQVLEAGVFPIGLEKLYIGSYEERLLKNVIPHTVTDLKIGHPQNYTLENIPDGVISLWIHSDNKHLRIKPNSIPFSVKHLKFESYEMEITSSQSIPNSVISIDFNRGSLKTTAYNNQIDLLPYSILLFKYSSRYDKLLIDKSKFQPNCIYENYKI